MTEPIAVGWHAVQNARLAPDDVPLVVGCGPVGLAVIAGLVIKDVHPDHRRRFLAGAAGAGAEDGRRHRHRSGRDLALRNLAADRDARRATTAAATPSFSASGPKLRPAVIFECVGVPGVIQQVMEGAPASARIVVVGVCMETDRIEPFFGIVKQLNVQFVLAYTAQEFAESLHHIAEGKVDVAPLVTGTVGLDGVSDAFAELANPERHAKVLVDPWTERQRLTPGIRRLGRIRLQVGIEATSDAFILERQPIPLSATGWARPRR